MTDRIVNYPIVYIPVKNLSVVWVQAQRPFNEKWGQKIADEFDPDKFEPIIITQPNGAGIYHVVEGQHRRYALERFAAKMNRSGNGADEQAPCHIIESADPKRAAEIWLGINVGRKKVSAVSEFKVAVTACREPELSVNHIVLRCGYRVTSDHSDSTIIAVGALCRIYQQYEEMVLYQTLNVLRSIWGGDPQAVSGGLLRGFAMFLNEFGRHYDKPRLPKIVSAKYGTPWRFLDAAKAHKERTMETLEEAVAELLQRDYNRGVPEDKRLKRK